MHNVDTVYICYSIRVHICGIFYYYEILKVSTFVSIMAGVGRQYTV